MSLKSKLKSIADKAWNAYKNGTSIRQEEYVDFELSNETIKHIFEKTGIDTTGYTRLISIKEVKHVFDKHGNEKAEANRGQIAVVPGDIVELPELLKIAEIIDHSTTKQGISVLVYRIQTATTVIYIEEVRTGRKKLALKTMRKHKRKNWI